MALTPWVSQAWYIDYCVSKGLVVEYWDLRLMFLGDKRQRCLLDKDPQKEHLPKLVGDQSPRLTLIRSYEHLQQLINERQNHNVLYVMLLTYSWRFVSPFVLLSKYSQRMIFIDVGDMPINPTGVAKKSGQLRRLLSSPLKKGWSYITNQLPNYYRKLGVVKPYELVFTVNPAPSKFLTIAKKTVGINLRDYDQYKRFQNNEKIFSYKYAVFIDQNLPEHPDLELLKLKRLNLDEYYGALDRFFEQIKQLFKLDIVVATHPTNNRAWTKSASRATYAGITEGLIKDAEFVIAHTSTAISYAVLNMKPIVFIYTEQMKVLYKNTIIQQIRAIAKYLGTDTYNINQLNELERLTVAEPILHNYEKYKYQYLTNTESENKYSDEIFFSELVKLFQ